MSQLLRACQGVVLDPTRLPERAVRLRLQLRRDGLRSLPCGSKTKTGRRSLEQRGRIRLGSPRATALLKRRWDDRPTASQKAEVGDKGGSGQRFGVSQHRERDSPDISSQRQCPVTTVQYDSPMKSIGGGARQRLETGGYTTREG